MRYIGTATSWTTRVVRTWQFIKMLNLNYVSHFILTDPRVQNFFLLSSPLPTLLMCIFYAYFSKSLGPRLMANRKPMDLRKILVYYNAIQTIFSAWIFYEVNLFHTYISVYWNDYFFFYLQYLMSGWWGHYSFKCQPVDYSNNPMAIRVSDNQICI